MDIRNSLEGLKSLLGVPTTAPAQTQPVKQGPSAAASAAPLAQRPRHVEQRGNEVSQTAGESGVRTDKVAAVQAALAAGTYNVPAAAVAGKVVDAMLGGGQGSATDSSQRPSGRP